MTSSQRRSGFRLPWNEESAAGTPAAEPAPADSAATAAEPQTEAVSAATPDAFLGTLTDAMRGVVESARQDSLRQAKAAVDERLGLLKSQSAERASELRTRTEADVVSFEEWSRAEADRIRVETDRKIEQRRQKLEEQLAEHEAKTAAETAALEARLVAHEDALARFFAELEAIKDPAAFIAAARTMPSLSLEAETADTATAASESKPKTEAKAKAAPEPASGEVLEDRLRDLGLQGGDAEPAPAGDEPAAPVATDPAPAGATAESNGGSTVSDVTAQGLASFGAVTALKQALARLDGVASVTLSLGPTGEFMYRIVHSPSFDVEAALRSAQPDATVERTPEGSYRLEVPTAA
jgi:hypothetical protein